MLTHLLIFDQVSTQNDNVSFKVIMQQMTVQMGTGVGCDKVTNTIELLSLFLVSCLAPPLPFKVECHGTLFVKYAFVLR